MRTYFNAEFKILAYSLAIFFALAFIGCALDTKFSKRKTCRWLCGLGPTVEIEVIVPEVDTGPWEA